MKDGTGWIYNLGRAQSVPVFVTSIGEIIMTQEDSPSLPVAKTNKLKAVDFRSEWATSRCSRILHPPPYQLNRDTFKLQKRTSVKRYQPKTTSRRAARVQL